VVDVVILPQSFDQPGIAVANTPCFDAEQSAAVGLQRVTNFATRRAVRTTICQAALPASRRLASISAPWTFGLPVARHVGGRS
jgi:hypothetical protein